MLQLLFHCYLIARHLVQNDNQDNGTNDKTLRISTTNLAAFHYFAGYFYSCTQYSTNLIEVIEAQVGHFKKHSILFCSWLSP